MKKFFLSLVIFSLIAGLAFLFFKSLIQVSPLEAVLIVDKRAGISEISVEDTFVIKPQLLLPGQIQIYRVPILKNNFDMRLDFDPPLIQVAGLFEQMKIRLHLIGSYIPIRGKISLMYRKFRDLLPHYEQGLKKEVRIFFSKVISEHFQDPKKFRELGSNGIAALNPALAKFKTNMAGIGIEISEIKFGLETNIPSFSNFYLNVYNSPQVVKLLKEKTVEILTLKNQNDKERASIELNEKLKLFRQVKELERLKIVAEFLKKYPEAYKVMVLEKMGKNVKVMVVPEMEKFPNIFRLLEEKSLQKKGGKGSGSTLQPGEFLAP